MTLMTLDEIFDTKFNELIDSEYSFQLEYQRLTPDGKKAMLFWAKCNFINNFFETDELLDKKQIQRIFKIFEHKPID